MNRLLFKNWLISEMADFGYGRETWGKPKGGTQDIEGQEVFKSIDGSKIISELSRMPALGSNFPYKKWNDMVEWGNGNGAIQAGVTPLGSMHIVVRRLINDLQGEPTWICSKIVSLKDNKSENKELNIAHDVYGEITELANQMVPAPSKEYEDFKRFCERLWTDAKSNHPSYCMFPTSLRQQNENYYKLVFEFRGHGVLRQKSGRPSRAEQFNIDVIWENKKGLIKVMGYDIDSTLKQHSWSVKPSEFNEYFSPNQEESENIDNIIKIFMQY